MKRSFAISCPLVALCLVAFTARLARADATSADGNVKVLAPLANEAVHGTFVIVGTELASGNTVRYRLTDGNGNVIVEGSGNSQDESGRGPFSITVNVPDQPSSATLRVYVDDNDRDRANVPLAIASDGEGATTPLYRLYHDGFGSYLYTPYDEVRDDGIKNRNFVSQGTQGYVYRYGDSDHEPIYSLRHPNAEVNHRDRFYTMSWEEAAAAVNKFGYDLTGISGYAMRNETAGLTPWHRLYNGEKRLHRYTTDAAERDRATSAQGYSSEGVAAYLPAP